MAPKRKMTGNGHPSKKAKTSKKGWSGKKYVKARDQELKFFDTALSFTADATGEVPATGQLALIAQGDGESNRDGRKCTLKSILIQGQLLYAPSTGAQATANVHIFLVQDKQANGAAAAVTDVLTTNGFGSAVRNLANNERFKIIKHFIIEMNPHAGATTAYNNLLKPWQYYKKLDIPMEYSSTTGAITEIKSNNLFLMAGSEGTNVDDLITVTGTARLRFVG